MIALADVQAAAARIATYVRRTPVLAAEALESPLPAGQLFLKLECLQTSGSFKARGATNKLLSLSPDDLAAGVVTASGGNHGLAVARVASRAKVPATIFLPANVSPEKVGKLERWGARTQIVGRVWDEANEAALAHAAATGAAYFHAFADPLVVAGQGTVGLEILEQVPDVDTIVIAIGGGGLIGGIATAAKALKPSVRILGVEPRGAPTLHACLAAGRLVTLDHVTTSVPTMAARQTTEANLAIVSANVDRVVLIEDDDMRSAARWLWFEMGIAADLGGSAAVAAVLAGHITPQPGERVCALVGGAGADGTVA
jgi:threonine dehydratase